jgi:pimeloyl-ACP methyl ester carboxylesterase
MQEALPQHRESDEEKLRKGFKKKSFLEERISGFQTRKAPIRGAKNPELTRGEIFRFERGQIVKAYKTLREQIRRAEKKGEDATNKRNLLQEVRGRAKILERNLDELERQYYENVTTVEVETKFGKFSVPVVELDLRKKTGEESGEDSRTPYFLLGTVRTNYHQTAALSMSLALDGKRVFVPAWPEQAMVGKPDNFGQLLKKQDDLEIHKEFAKQTIRSIGLRNINLMGVSMGGAVALELAQDPDFQEMQDLVVIEPPGLEEKGMARLAKDFVVEEGLLKSFPLTEARIKTLMQGTNTGGIDFLADDCKILAKKQFDSEKLSNINPKGRYQLWIGTESSITDYETAERVFLEAEDLRRQKDSDMNSLEIHVVEGGNHGWPFMSSLGFSKLLDEDKPGEQISSVKLSDLENSGMDEILKELTHKDD